MNPEGMSNSAMVPAKHSFVKIVVKFLGVF